MLVQSLDVIAEIPTADYTLSDIITGQISQFLALETMRHAAAIDQDLVDKHWNAK